MQPRPIAETSRSDAPSRRRGKVIVFVEAAIDPSVQRSYQPRGRTDDLSRTGTETGAGGNLADQTGRPWASSSTVRTRVSGSTGLVRKAWNSSRA